MTQPIVSRHMSGGGVEVVVNIYRPLSKVKMRRAISYASSSFKKLKGIVENVDCKNYDTPPVDVDYVVRDFVSLHSSRNYTEQHDCSAVAAVLKSLGKIVRCPFGMRRSFQFCKSYNIPIVNVNTRKRIRNNNRELRKKRIAAELREGFEKLELCKAELDNISKEREEIYRRLCGEESSAKCTLERLKKKIDDMHAEHERVVARSFDEKMVNAARKLQNIEELTEQLRSDYAIAKDLQGDIRVFLDKRVRESYCNSIQPVVELPHTLSATVLNVRKNEHIQDMIIGKERSLFKTCKGGCGDIYKRLCEKKYPFIVNRNICTHSPFVFDFKHLLAKVPLDIQYHVEAALNALTQRELNVIKEYKGPPFEFHLNMHAFILPKLKV